MPSTGHWEGEPLDAALTEVSSIDVMPRTFNPFDGGLRKRLRVRLRDGSEALFVVNSPAKTGRKLAQSVSDAGGADTVDL